MVPVTPLEYRIIEDVLHARYPHVHGWLRDELVSAGHEGLTRAARQYDNDDHRGKSFRNYAWTLVQYAMQDEMRRIDHLSRAARTAVRNTDALQDEADQLTGRTAPPADVLGWITRVDHVTQDHATDPGAPVPLDPSQVGALADPRDQHTHTEGHLDATRQVAHALKHLTPREQAVIRCGELLDWPRQDIAQALGVTTSRITQIRAKALRDMRATLEAA